MNNLFYSYYDALFQKKDYTKEAELVFSLSEKYGIKSPKKILEIGCGTGNHTLVLSEKDVQVVALDTDIHMIEKAKEKINKKNIKLVHSYVEDLNESDFDLALAMFNVVTYIPQTEQLISFMKATAKCLKKGGVFVFDCWNGIAVIKDPPHKKTTEIEYLGEKIEIVLNPETDFFNQKTTLSYHLKVESAGEIKKDHFSFGQTLWIPMQIQYALTQAGLELILCSPIM